MVDYQPNQVLATKEFKVVGSRPIRHDGADKVTGQAKYGADIQLPGLLFGKILRSPYAHARIKSIDTSKALALPGVHAVVTASDWDQPSGKVEDLAEGSIHNLRFLSNNVLAYEKVLYKGHAIAGVAAEGAHLAEQAAALIEVDYEVLPPVVNFTSAMAEDAPDPARETWRASPIQASGPAATNPIPMTVRGPTSPTVSISSLVALKEASTNPT